MAGVLFAWVSNADLRAAAGDGDVGLGPIACAVRERVPDEVVLLSSQDEAATHTFVSWLRARTRISVVLHLAPLARPRAYDAIHDAAVEAILAAEVRRPPRSERMYHLSPGAPAMVAIWIILAKTRFPGELIESTADRGVWTVSAPFELTSELLPELLHRADARLAERGAERAPEDGDFGDIVHRSAAMRRLVGRARRTALRQVPVLLEGESGTGKELIARAIHSGSARVSAPFVAVNCGAIPEGLVESELFGHERGAFTGAVASRVGHFRAAHGGTLFLDEVGELPLAAQVKLLRALQEREVTPVGASRPVPFDARIIAATHRNLLREVAAGRFRADLFYRLAVAVLQVPALRDRPGDLSLLAERLLAQVNDEHASDPGFERKRLTQGGLGALMAWAWPGNVRELQNTLRRAALWSTGPTLGAEEIRDALLDDGAHDANNPLARPIGENFSLPDTLGDVARHYLTRAIAEHEGNLTRAAAALGLASHQTLSNWLAKYNVKVPRRRRG